jgi:hypothetical protein
MSEQEAPQYSHERNTRLENAQAALVKLWTDCTDGGGIRLDEVFAGECEIQGRFLLTDDQTRVMSTQCFFDQCRVRSTNQDERGV